MVPAAEILQICIVSLVLLSFYSAIKYTTEKLFMDDEQQEKCKHCNQTIKKI